MQEFVDDGGEVKVLVGIDFEADVGRGEGFFPDGLGYVMGEDAVFELDFGMGEETVEMEWESFSFER